MELFALFFQVACHLHADIREIVAVNDVIKHQVERAGFRGSLNLISLGESSTPKWSEFEPHVARARADAMHWFPCHEGVCKSRAASHQSRTLPMCAQCPPCKMQPSPRPNTSALRAARAYDVSPNPWNAVKVQRALTLLIDSISPRSSGPRNTTCCGDAPRQNAHCHQALLAAPRQAWLWPILYRNIGHMVTCELTGDSGGIGKPTHVKLVRPLSCSSSVTVFANMFSKVLCGPRVECKTQELEWSRDWTCAKLVG